MLEKQDSRRLNTAELILPAETGQAAVLPSVMPKSPLDWPVEMFTQALDRREVNRKALLKWIESNLQPRIDPDWVISESAQACRRSSPHPASKVMACSSDTCWGTPVDFHSLRTGTCSCRLHGSDRNQCEAEDCSQSI